MKNLIISTMLGLALLSVPACSTTANNRAVKTQQVLIPTVNIAMEQWSVHVNKGKATQAQVDTVKTAYQAYYTAQVTFKAALEKSINGTSTVVSETDVNLAARAAENAKTSLLFIISQLLK